MSSRSAGSGRVGPQCGFGCGEPGGRDGRTLSHRNYNKVTSYFSPALS